MDTYGGHIPAHAHTHTKYFFALKTLFLLLFSKNKNDTNLLGNWNFFPYMNMYIPVETCVRYYQIEFQMLQ